MKRFNEFPSPKVDNPLLAAYMILHKLDKENYGLLNQLENELGLERHITYDVLETLFQQLIDEEVLTECGSCGCYHRRDFNGDCRNNDERFP